jgi:adenylylsulfate kinase
MAGVTIWITGLPGSGKSALAEGLKREMPGFVILRMDELRRIATPEPTYSEVERDILYRSLVFAAKTLAELGREVIIDATGNMRKWRELAREVIPGYAEVYLRCPLEVCAEREGGRANTHAAPRGIYEKAAGGWPVPGVSVPYEEPLGPELVLDTDRVSLEDEVRETINLIERLRAQVRGLTGAGD